MKTRLTSLLGIEYPMIQGGMAWVANASLASAVSNAGGLGLIAGRSRSCRSGPGGNPKSEVYDRQALWGQCDADESLG